MPSRDNINQNKAVVALAPATQTATANGVAIDTQGFDGAAIAHFLGHTSDSMGPTVNIKLNLQESDDGTTWYACNDSDIAVPRPQSSGGYGIGTANGATVTGCFAIVNSSGQVPSSGQYNVYGVSYFGARRYIRVVEEHNGTQSSGTPSFSTAWLGHPNYMPVWGNIADTVTGN